MSFFSSIKKTTAGFGVAVGLLLSGCGDGGDNGTGPGTSGGESTFTDGRDSKRYNTVKIGSQTWMAENLNYETPSGSWCYRDKPDSCKKYGRVYDWATAMNGSSSSNSNPSGVQGVCPSGWHFPSEAEWTALIRAVGSSPGTKLKSTSGWRYDGNGTDDYGFSALPGGERTGGDSELLASWSDVGNRGCWWSTTVLHETAFGLCMEYNASSVSWHSWGGYEHSVRCVKN